MADMQNYEFVVSQKLTGKWLAYRILAVVGYVLFVVGFFILGTTLFKFFLPMIALTPIFLWMLIFFTWRYTRPDYELTTVSNTLRFTVVYGNRTRRPQLEVEFPRMRKIAPLDEAGEAEIQRYAPEKVYCAASSMDARDLYYALWEEDKKTCVLYFEATTHLLKICKYYNSAATVVTPVSR